MAALPSRPRLVVLLAACLSTFVAIGGGPPAGAGPLSPFLTSPSSPAAPPAPRTPFPLRPPSGYLGSQLQFQDTFAGTQLDPSKWVSYIASRGSDGIPWNSNGSGGSSLENPGLVVNKDYDLPSQVHVRDGLDLSANRQPTSGVLGSAARVYPWRGGVVSTYQKFDTTGGYVQVEAKVPAGSGLWPGLWMLPGPGTTHADHFEIDIFEGGFTARHVPAGRTYAWHLHTPRSTIGGVVDSATDLSAGYHVYAARWVPGRSVTWYLDGRVVGQVTSATAPIPTQPMELILDLGVATPSAGSYHSVPNGSTPRTAQLSISEVQVYH